MSMVVLLKILQVILALSVLILIHESGHFLFAKLFGVRVDKFYLFFDAGNVRLFSTKNNRFLGKIFPKLKDNETDYGIGWLPIGGYCKISGMIDESMDTDFLASEPKPYEFRSKPAWQRLLIMAGGVLFNFIFAIIVYIGILSHWGENYFSNDDNQIYVNELSYEMGFRNGDHIISFDDYVPDNFGMLQADFARRSVRKATVLRNGDTLDIYIDHALMPEVLKTPGMFDLAIPFVVDTIPPASVNNGSLLRRGDRIVSLEGHPIEFVQDSRPVLSELFGKEITAEVIRDADSLSIPLRVDSLGKLGIYAKIPEYCQKEYSVAEAVPAGFRLCWDTIRGYIDDLKLVFTPSTEAYKSVGSFIAIGQIFPSSWDWFQFLHILALLSIMLGVMNLLPIPALDGGHIVFTLYEIITGRKPGDKFLAVSQIIGMILLLALMVLAFGNDIGRLIK